MEFINGTENEITGHLNDDSRTIKEPESATSGSKDLIEQTKKVNGAEFYAKVIERINEKEIEAAKSDITKRRHNVLGSFFYCGNDELSRDLDVNQISNQRCELT